MAPALKDLTPELRTEVRRSFTCGMSITVACMAAFSIVFALAVDPGMSMVTGGVAVSIFALTLGLLLPSAVLLLSLVYYFDCWPAMLRGRLLREQYMVSAEDLSGKAWRQAMGSGGFWAAAGRGAIIGLAFMTPVMLAWWGLTGKWGFVVPSTMLVLLAAQMTARSWFVRRVVTQARVPVPLPQDPEPGAPAIIGP